MISEDRFELKSGGGAMMLFGLPFLLIGLAVITITVVPDLVDNAPPLIFGIIFGCIFATVGGSLVFGRSKIVIDKIRGTFTKRWSVIIPLKTNTFELSEFSHVQITKEVRRSDKSTYTVYPVYLQGPSAQEKVKEGRDYQASRQLSELLSKLLDYDVVDESSGEEVVRRAGTMDQSVRDQILESGEEVILPPEPANMKSDSYMLGESLVVEIPPAGFSPVMLVGLVPLLFMFPFFGFFFFGFESGGEGELEIAKLIFSIVPLLFMAIPLFIVYRIFVAPLFEKAKLELDKYELRYTTMGALSKTVVLKCDEIEELFVKGKEALKMPSGQKAPELAKKLARTMGGGGIAIRTDAKTLLVGAHLELEEQLYILAAMKQVIIS